MTFDLDQECKSILDALPETLPDHSKPTCKGELAHYRKELEEYAGKLQHKYPTLARKKVCGIGKLYAYDPEDYIPNVEQDIVAHWLTNPDSLALTAKNLGILASSWYGRPVSEHRIKRRFSDRDLARRLQQLCYEQGNTTDIGGCRSLPEIQKRLRLRARRASAEWSFEGEITFHSDGTVAIRNTLAQQDTTKAGKRRVRGNGSAVAVEALRNVLLAYS